MTEKVIHGIGCPSCGGSLEIIEGTAVVQCKFCSTSLRVKGDRGISRYYVPLKSTREQILNATRKWLDGFDKAPRLSKDAKFTEIFPIYVPFWRVTALVIGWVLGDVKKGSGKNTHYEPVERRVFSKQEFTCPACDIGEFGVKEIDLAGDEILPFALETVQKSAMTFEILNTPGDAVELCESQFMQKAERSAGVTRKKFTKLHMLNFQLSVIYYPLWVVRYEYRNRVYQVTADGESSRLLYGRAPGNNLFRVACLLGAILPADFIFTSYLHGDPDDGAFGIAFLCIIFMYLGYRKFRYGGEVKLEQNASSFDLSKFDFAEMSTSSMVDKLKQMSGSTE